ncbi:hypothetical protein Cni_G21540 [Canna indica]|uniref:Uncharacterized protein n=1 Tax=Canna indica TaxID=4628 RepID=A0AAQ3KSB6_9LILI|nr:hypothetical protein Cni_G21540 [Canna indica]
MLFILLPGNAIHPSRRDDLVYGWIWTQVTQALSPAKQEPWMVAKLRNRLTMRSKDFSQRKHQVGGRDAVPSLGQWGARKLRGIIICIFLIINEICSSDIFPFN